jgi:hypothetical protein
MKCKVDLSDRLRVSTDVCRHCTGNREVAGDACRELVPRINVGQRFGE